MTNSAPRAILGAVPYRAKPLAVRFWAKVAKRHVGCWLWKGPIDTKGYGYLADEGGKGIHYAAKKVRAHRVSWELHNGPIPDGLNVLHRCDVRACVRPSHLFLGTQRDNLIDAREKGRLGSGDAVRHAARLNWDEVGEIRRRHAAGETRKSLRQEFGVGKTQMHRIIVGEQWAH